MLLRNKDRESLIAIFSTLKVPVEVLAYGSRVSGGAHEGSDLDLVIRAMDGKRLPFPILNQLKSNIQESNIPILVELHDWWALPDNFHLQIEKSNELLFSNISNVLNEPSNTYKPNGDENKS